MCVCAVPCSKYLEWTIPYFASGRLDVIKLIIYATYQIVSLFLWSSHEAESQTCYCSNRDALASFKEI